MYVSACIRIGISFSKRGAKFLYSVSWQTKAWIADEPCNLIHFNGREGSDALFPAN